MKAVSYNIRFGPGKDGRNDLQTIADAIQATDISALQNMTVGMRAEFMLPGYLDHGPDDPEFSPLPHPGGNKYDLPARWTLTGKAPRKGATYHSAAVPNGRGIDFTFVGHHMKEVRNGWIGNEEQGSNHPPPTGS